VPACAALAEVVCAGLVVTLARHAVGLRPPSGAVAGCVARSGDMTRVGGGTVDLMLAYAALAEVVRAGLVVTLARNAVGLRPPSGAVAARVARSGDMTRVRRLAVDLVLAYAGLAEVVRAGLVVTLALNAVGCFGIGAHARRRIAYACDVTRILSGAGDVLTEITESQFGHEGVVVPGIRCLKGSRGCRKITGGSSAGGVDIVHGVNRDADAAVIAAPTEIGRIEQG
jgi:hypothetical protein